MMNTLQKSLTIAFLAVSIFVSGLSVDLASAQSSAPESMVTLTPEEKSWIKAHSTITLSITDDIPPRSFIDKDGKIKGTTVDFVRLFEQKLGLKINLVGSDWATALKRALDHEVDGILQAAELEERKPYLNFTQVYSYTPMAIIAGEDEPTISAPDALCGRRVGVLKDSSQSHYLMKHFPCINVVHFKALEQVAYALAGGEIHAVFGNYDYYASQFKQAGLVGFKAIYMEYLPPTGFARIGLRNDDPLLLSIFDKAIAAITDDERARISNRWLGLKFSSVLAELGARVNLTLEEKAWLAQDHTVRVRVVNLPPYMFLEGDKIKGVVIDYLKIIAQRAGLTFQFSPETRPWQEALKSLKNLQGPDLMASLLPLAEHEPYMDFSQPYIASARVIFTRTDGEFISTIDDLEGRTLAVPHGTLVHKRIEAEYPDIGLLLYDTDLESIEAVSTGKADAYIGNLINASYEILHRGFANLKVAAPSPFGDDVHTFGIRRDWPELSSIINKGLDSITSEEKAAIHSKHMKLKYEYGIKPSDIFKSVLMIAGPASLVLLLILFWNRSLAKQVRERTSELTSNHKLLEAEIVERKQAEEGFREGRDYLKRLTDSMADAVFSVTAIERKIEWANDSFEILGYEPEECIGRTTEFLYPNRKDFLDFGHMLASAIAEGKEIVNIEQPLRRKSGEVFPADITLTFFRTKGKVESVTAIVRDISERKQAEQALQGYQQRLKALASQQTITEERERRRIAADLHDHVGQELALARIRIASVRKHESDPGQAVTLDEISDSLRHTIQETRDLIRDLSPPLLNEIGLSAAISEWLEEQVEKKHALKAECIGSVSKEPIDDDLRAVLFRSVRELVTNVIKHARATRVNIRVSQDHDRIKVSVEDDGAGFDTDTLSQSLKIEGGFGLLSIKERMANLGGSLEIISEPGKGTEVTLVVPLEKGEGGE